MGRSRGAAFAGVVIAVSAGAAGAASPPKPATPQATTVSELVVTATKSVAELTVTGKIRCLPPDRSPERASRPRIVSAFPGKDATVRPGLVVMRVTFDQPMACTGLFTNAAPMWNPCPGETQEMLLSLDRKTVRTVCVVEPDRQYAAWVTQDPLVHGFIGLGGLPSVAYRMSFTTSAEAPVTSVCEALLEDAETAQQMRQRGVADCASAH